RIVFLYFFYVSAAHLYLHSFPTRRSSDLNDFCFIFFFTLLAVMPRNFSGRTYATAVTKPQSSSTANSDLRSGRSSGYSSWFHSRSEEHTSELQSRFDLVCRLLLEKKKSLV